MPIKRGETWLDLYLVSAINSTYNDIVIIHQISFSSTYMRRILELQGSEVLSNTQR